MIDGIWLLLRAAGLMLSCQAGGMALFLLLFPLPPQPAARIARAARTLALAAAAVLSAQLLCEPLHLAGAWSGITDPEQWRLLAGDSAAYALLLRLAAALLLAYALRWPLRRGALSALALLLLSFAVTGHTRAAPAPRGAALVVLLHVSIVLLWFGALWPLRLLLASVDAVLAAGVVAAFSRLALWLVPLLAALGVLLAALLLPDLAALWQPYGLALLTKSALFVLLLGLAGLNRLRLAPAAARGETRALRQLRGSILAEIVLLLAVLGVTAVLSGALSPGEG
jgi:putative copper export protein